MPSHDMQSVVAFLVASASLLCGACVIHVPKKVDLAVDVREEGHAAAPSLSAVLETEALGGLQFAVEPALSPGRVRVRWRPTGSQGVVVRDAAGRGRVVTAPRRGSWHVLEVVLSAREGPAARLVLDAPRGGRREPPIPVAVRRCTAPGAGSGVGVAIRLPARPQGPVTLRIREGARGAEIDFLPRRTAIAARPRARSSQPPNLPVILTMGPNSAPSW